ncbi:hypothetical protein BGZ59_003916, partial [Podila verticillata]
DYCDYLSSPESDGRPGKEYPTTIYLHTYHKPPTRHFDSKRRRHRRLESIGQINWNDCTVTIRSYKYPELNVSPLNDTINYDGASLYMFRIKTPFGTHVDSATFVIANTNPSHLWGSL